ncbi:unnamed protein product [Sphagnum balticum]
MAHEDGGRKGVREGRKDGRTEGAAGAAAVAFIQATECDSSSSYNCSDRSARTDRKKLMQRVKNKQKLDCKKPGASEQQLIETVGGGDAAPESYAPDSWKKKMGEHVTPSSIPVMGDQSVEYELPSPAQELPEEVNVAGAAAADVQSELQGPQMTKCNAANGDAQDAVETVSPVEKAVSSADKSSSSGSSSYEEVEEEDDKAKRESCGLSDEVLDTTNESVEMEEEHIRDHANSNGRDHVVDDVCSKSSEIAQISPKVEENGESGGSSTTSSSGNGTAEAAAAATIDQTDVAKKCRNGDSNIGTKEGIGVAPETNGTDHHKEGEDVNELLRNVPSDEAEKDSASLEETKDTSSSSTHIGDYLVTPAEDPIAGSCMEEDVIAVKHHDLQMRGASSTTVGYTVSTTVETFTNSVTYSKEDGFAGFEEENTSSSSNSKKKAPYFEDHHNDNNDKSMASSSLNSAEGESEVQRVLRLQTTHDLLCPVCGSCITKRVILRKRKRTSPSVVSVEKWVLLNEEEIQSQDTLEEPHTSPTTTAAAVKEEATIVEPAAAAAADGHGYEYEEDWGCLACFTLFFRRARLQSDVEDDELVEEEESPLVRKRPQIHDEKREVVAATTIESPKPVEQQEKAEAIGVEDTTPSSGGGTLAAASVGEEEHQEIKEEPCDQDLLPDEEIEAPDTAPPAAVVEEIEEHQPPQLVLPVEKLEISPTTDISTSISDVSDETTTSVIMTTDESVIEVHGSDAPSTLEAVTAAAEDLGMMTLTSTGSKVQEYLKSVVYGGLDVSLISLGVVASAAGGDAKTRTVLAMGLANLIFGSISFFHKVIELHKESPMRFRETVGQSFLLNGCLAFLSFLVFGSLPTLTFGFSFRQSNNHDYKMLATVVVSVISVVLLGCAKVFAKVTQQSYFATLSALIMTGVVAAVAGFYTGEYFSKLLAQFGFDT